MPGRTSSFPLPNPLLLAPIAGYSDAAFRSICLEYGAGLGFTEMVSAEALARGNQATLELARRADNERHLCIQLFASNPQSARAAVRILLPLRPALIDLNCGCSVAKVLRSGCGAALMRDPPLVREIVASLREGSSLPVSIKMRSGWDAGSINYLAVAEQAIAGGACLVSLHPRTRAQGFTGQADLEHLRILKQSIGVPVVGSGSLFTPQDARAMLEATGCDGVMFARGAVGNPFIFRQTRALLSQGQLLPPPGPAERLHAAMEHLALAVRWKGEPVACREMRKHFCAYTRGLPDSAWLRRKILRAETLLEYRLLAEGYLQGRG